MGALRILLPVTVASLAMAGCGSSASKTVVETQTVTTPATTQTQTASTPTTSTATTTTPAPPPVTRVVHLPFFQTPSHNIGCAIAAGLARCDIRHRSWSPPPQPSSCRLDWGQGLRVPRRGAAGFVCAGDTTLNPQGKVLAYGERSVVGHLECTSRTEGIRCASLTSGRGFFLSRGSYREF